MSVRNLDCMFKAESIAVIGASERPFSVGKTVLDNLVGSKFAGPIFPVNPKYRTLFGHKVYARITDLPVAPDLAILCTPPDTLPELIGQLGARGTKAVIVITALGGHDAATSGDSGAGSLTQRMLEAAKPHLLRILGPNCVGLLIPSIGLNAGFAHTDALTGKIAFLSQSGALVTGVLDWAKSRNIGFSKFVSLGDSADIDFGDMLDYLASDPDTHAILLYVEAIKHARKFMSAARAAARSKPVVVVKAGRVPESAKAAASHTGALAGADDVYDAAIRRAGMVRVLSTNELFSTVETLARARPLSGDRLAIMTNGGGPGVMATDALIDHDGRLATLSAETLRKLDAVLPALWSHGNPVDMIGDAPASRYAQTLEILLREPASDAILFIHAPTAIVPSTEIANAIAPLAKGSSRNIIACWLGGDTVAPARRIFSDAGIATYDTPEEAVDGFMQMVQYHRNQNLLMEVPPSLPTDCRPDRAVARSVIQQVLAANRTMLTEPEAKVLLDAYGIPTVKTSVVHSVAEAVEAAVKIGFPVAVKILSPDISHKSDVGGVALDLETPRGVQAAALSMQKRLHGLLPDARLTGFTVQAMARRPDAHELIVGVTTDPVFGPVILFGQGGIAVEVMADHAVALPPLNMALARDLISRTRVAKLLAGYRNRPPADLDAICNVLIRTAHLATDMAEIAELDINPLLADSRGVIALDARVQVNRVTAGTSGLDRLAILPYPEGLEESISWQGKPLRLRPIRPEDAPQHVQFFAALTPEDIRYRMFLGMRELQAAQLARFTQIDYDREMAFIATRTKDDGTPETLGVVRAVSDPDNIAAEFAIVVRSDLKGCGLGKILMAKLIAYCRSRGTQEIVGESFRQNTALLKLVRDCGFQIEALPEGETVGLRLRLTLPDSANQPRPRTR